MTLTKREISTLIRLLGVLQCELDICIDSNTPPMGQTSKREMASWQRDRKQAVEFVKKFEATQHGGNVGVSGGKEEA